MTPNDDHPTHPLDSVTTWSSPSKLEITDITFAQIVGAPTRCILLRVSTNQGIVGLGEVRDGATPTYALMLKERLLGENPCDVDRLFRRIRQFGHHGRQGGGVSGIEVALWDIAGKAYGVPAYQLLGGRFRDRVRLYCDTDIRGRDDEAAMARALEARLAKGFTFLKMDLGINRLAPERGEISAPVGYLAELEDLRQSSPWWGQPVENVEQRRIRNRRYDAENQAHPFTGIRLTERGIDALERHFAKAREVVGPEVPLAVDHVGHIGLADAIRLARRLEPYHPAWLEDLLPWQLTDQYVRLAEATTIPICTGEDIYLAEGFDPLVTSGGIAIAHPDVLTAGGMLETKKIADFATRHGVALALHMAETPIGCLAAAHTAVAAEHILGVEYHAADVPWWDDLVSGGDKPINDNGFVTVSDRPGLGVDDWVDEVVAEHTAPWAPEPWSSTEVWDREWSHDRLWS